jgi:hypothetical protein
MYSVCRLELPHYSPPFSMPFGVEETSFQYFTLFRGLSLSLAALSAIHSHVKKVIRNLEMRPFEILQSFLICAPNAVCVHDFE